MIERLGALALLEAVPKTEERLNQERRENAANSEMQFFIRENEGGFRNQKKLAEARKTLYGLFKRN